MIGDDYLVVPGFCDPADSESAGNLKSLIWNRDGRSKTSFKREGVLLYLNPRFKLLIEAFSWLTIRKYLDEMECYMLC